MGSTEKQADIRLLVWGIGKSSVDAVLLLELRFALQTMSKGMGVKNPRMLMIAASNRVAILKQHKDKAQE